MKDGVYGKFFRFCRVIFRLFWKSHKTVGAENIIPGAVYVSHHQNQYGPFSVLAYFIHHVHIWAFAPFCTQRGTYKQYMDYTFTVRMKIWRPLAAVLAFPLSIVVGGITQSGQAIPVYRGGSTQVMETLRKSLSALKKKESVVIFVDVDYKSESAYTGEIYPGFLSLERLYLKQTGKHLPFIPLYVSKGRREIHVGKSVCFKGEEEFSKEMPEIAEELRDALNLMARQCGDIV